MKTNRFKFVCIDNNNCIHLHNENCKVVLPDCSLVDIINNIEDKNNIIIEIKNYKTNENRVDCIINPRITDYESINIYLEKVKYKKLESISNKYFRENNTKKERHEFDDFINKINISKYSIINTIECNSNDILCNFIQNFEYNMSSIFYDYKNNKSYTIINSNIYEILSCIEYDKMNRDGILIKIINPEIIYEDKFRVILKNFEDMSIFIEEKYLELIKSIKSTNILKDFYEIYKKETVEKLSRIIKELKEK